ncbi:MAG TPA: hypothetical protein VH817_00795 [Thermoleophilaceae bacterium]
MLPWLIAAALALALGGFALAAAPAAANTVTVSCAGTPGDCNTSDWYAAAVPLDWTVDPTADNGSTGCDDQSVTNTPPAGQTFTCTANWTTGDPPQASQSVTIHVDTTPPTVTGATPSVGASPGGWFTQPLTFDFTGSDASSGIASCSSNVPYNGPDSATATVSGSCTDVAGHVTPGQHGFKYDSTAPTGVSGGPNRSPDYHGWFNHQVTIAFVGTDAVSGVACTAPSYSGPDGGGISVPGSCTNGAGLNTPAVSSPFNYDATPPVLKGATAERGPDFNGWYNHPVTFTYSGTDAASGIATCSTDHYDGPQGAQVHTSGSCTDNAGNSVIGNGPTFKYDATPPGLPTLTTTPGNHRIDVAWTTSGASQVTLVRSAPGRTSPPRQIYSGSPQPLSFVDKGLVNGRRYVYTLTATDQAGNTRTRTMRGIPSGSSLRPYAGTAVGSAPLLTWKNPARARYYNLQLWRGGKKVMSTWPLKPSFQVPANWRFRGRRQTLKPGHYRWYVWPGYGLRKQNRYGRLIGTSSFRLR